jgi:hypothetical protein
MGEPKAKVDIVLDAKLLRRPRSAGPFPRASPRFLKEKLYSKREGNCAVDDEDTRDKEYKNKQQKKLVFGLTGRLQARSPADR